MSVDPPGTICTISVVARFAHISVTNNGITGCVDIDDALSINTLSEWRQLVVDDGGNRPFANAPVDACKKKHTCFLHSLTFQPNDTLSQQQNVSIRFWFAFVLVQVVVGVHIADVAAFVASGSAVDREARVRG